MVRRIVVLDGYTLNPGDLSWTELEKLGSLTVYDRSSPTEVAVRIRDAEIVFTNKVVLPPETISRADRLQFVGVLAAGFNVVDVEAAKDRGIPVCNVPDYGPESVAQMAFAHLLNFTQRVADHAASVRAGDWVASPDFCYWQHPLCELHGTTIGIVGLGTIGRATARIAHGFGMKVIATTRDASRVPPTGVSWRDLDELLAEADVVSLHCPLTPETKGIINAARLARMKPTAFLINTGRGPLLDEAALADALDRRVIAGAGLDVLSTEPPDANNSLLAARNCVITPHIAWATQAARQRLMSIAVNNLRQFLAGTPANCVNL